MNKTKTLYVFRHGETEWNAERRLQGHSDINLNTSGRLQAEQLYQAEILPIKQCQYIYVSDLKRSQETALIATGQKLPLKIDSRLREVFLGDFEGRTHPEILAEYGEDYWGRWYDFSFEHWDFKVPNGESKNELLQRGLLFLNDFLASSEQTGIVCGHGFWIRTMDSFLRKTAQHQTLKNCELVIWSFRDGTYLNN